MGKVKEMWKTIEGYPDYEVSTYGRVRSISRTIVVDGHERNYVSRVLRQNICSRGFANVTMSVEGHRVSKRVHRLVANAFIPRIEGKSQVLHRNGDPSNNSVGNLRWVSSIGKDSYIA